MPVTQEQLKAAAKSYFENGFAVIENFFDEDEVQSIKDFTTNNVRNHFKEMGEKVREGEVWEEPEKNDWYFQCEDAKTRFFYEPYAVDKKQMKLVMPPEQGISKMGYALHIDYPFFRDIMRKQQILDTFKALDYVRPTMIQMMVNFKNPRVGGEFFPHQDTSYLTTTKPEHVVGFWFALDDATVENGCLDVIPKSHKWPLMRRYVRCEGGKKADGSNLEWTTPIAIFDEKSYIKVPCKRGSLILIHGLLVHKSDPNKTDKSRWALAFHAFDNARCIYLDGWLPHTAPSFVPVFAY